MVRGQPALCGLRSAPPRSPATSRIKRQLHDNPTIQPASPWQTNAKRGLTPARPAQQRIANYTAGQDQVCSLISAHAASLLSSYSDFLPWTDSC